MSYILEALKKAEAERKGGVMRATPMLPPIGPASRNPQPWRRPLPWMALAGLSITLACAAWFAVTRSKGVSTPPPPAPVAQPAQPVVPPAPPPPLAAAQPKHAEPEVEKIEPAKPKEKPVKKRAEKKAPVAAPEAKTAQATETPLPTLRELPENLQREIPPLKVGGYIYSGNKADRSVLINQRLLHEGEEVAPGLLLEKMLPNGMVLNYRGQRYRTGY